MRNRPEKIIVLGKVRISIFRNVYQKSGEEFTVPKVTVSVSYRGEAGWKKTNTLSMNDIPKAILGLQQAYAYLLGRKSNGPT